MPAGGASLTNVGNNVQTGVTQTLPIDQPIVLQFNRLLNPNSVTRQSIQLLTSSGTGFADPVVDYDPVLMTVTLSNPGGGEPWLTAGLSYEISFPVPTSPSDTSGLQAIDDATFAMPTSVAFSAVAATGVNTAAPTMHFCVDILPIFTSKCSAPMCHGSPSGASAPAAGLVLDNSEGLALTAIGHVSHGSNTGANAGVVESPGSIFGVDMPIIDPGTNGTGDPADSWLLYKVLLAVPPPPSSSGDSIVQCSPYQTTEDYGRTAPNGQPLASPSAMTMERGYLSDFILGREMPYPSDPNYTESEAGPESNNLSVQELERLRLWIKQGAQLEIVTIPGPDGGTTSAGTNCGMCITQIVATGNEDAGTDAPTMGPPDAGAQE